MQPIWPSSGGTGWPRTGYRCWLCDHIVMEPEVPQVWPAGARTVDEVVLARLQAQAVATEAAIREHCLTHTAAVVLDP